MELRQDGDTVIYKEMTQMLMQCTNKKYIGYILTEVADTVIYREDYSEGLDG